MNHTNLYHINLEKRYSNYYIIIVMKKYHFKSNNNYSEYSGTVSKIVFYTLMK